MYFCAYHKPFTTMLNTPTTPEEPLFYIGLLIIICCFFYLKAKDANANNSKSRYQSLLASKINEAERNLQNSHKRLDNELSRCYPPEQVQQALDGYIFEKMPLVLLKTAMGTPDSIDFHGPSGQIWKYSNSQGQELIFNIWDDHVTTWQKTN